MKSKYIQPSHPPVAQRFFFEKERLSSDMKKLAMMVETSCQLLNEISMIRK